MAFYALRNYRNKILFEMEACISQNKYFFETDSSDEEKKTNLNLKSMLQAKHFLTP